MPDIIDVSDLILRFATKTRLFSDTTNVSDLVTQTSAREVVKTLSDSLTISEARAIQRSKQRPIPQTLTISEQIVSLIVHATRVRSLSEDLSITDAVTKSTVRDIIKTLTDTLSISESLGILRLKQRTISQTTNITETLQAYKNDELLIPPALPEVPNLIGTRERAVRIARRPPRPIVIDEIRNVAIAPLKLLAFSDSINIAIVGIKPRPALNVARSEIRIGFEPTLIAQSSIKTSLQPMEIKAALALSLPLSSLNLTTAKLKLRPQHQTIHSLKAVNFEKMHKLTRIMKIAMLAENL